MSKADIEALLDLFRVWEDVLREVPEVKGIEIVRHGNYQFFDVESYRYADIDDGNLFYVTFAINVNMGKKQLRSEVVKFAAMCYIYFDKVLPTL